jgi:hypothetical protein
MTKFTSDKQGHQTKQKQEGKQKLDFYRTVCRKGLGSLSQGLKPA